MSEVIIGNKDDGQTAIKVLPDGAQMFTADGGKTWTKLIAEPEWEEQ